MKVVPMALAFLVVVLGDVDEGKAVGMIEGAAVMRALQVPIVPHLGEKDLNSGGLRSGLDDLGPVDRPSFLTVRFVVHAVEDVRVGQRMAQHFVHEFFLEREHDGVVPLFRSGEKERLFIRPGVVRVGRGQARFLAGVVDIVGRLYGWGGQFFIE